MFVAGSVVIAVVAVAGGWDAWERLRMEAAGFPWASEPSRLALALACGTGALILTGRIWAALLGASGGRISSLEAVAAWLGSNLGRYLPGKVWQLAGIAAYLNARGDSGAAGFATSLALQAVILVTGVGVAVTVAGGAALAGVHPGAAAAAGLAVLALLHPAILSALMRSGARLLGEEIPAQAPGLAAVGRTALLSLIVWGLYGAGLSALTAGLAPDLGLGWAPATGVFAGAYVAGYVVLVAPGGLVVREGAMAALIVGATGAEPGVAAALAVAARLWTTGSELLAFAAAALMMRTRPTRG